MGASFGQAKGKGHSPTGHGAVSAPMNPHSQVGNKNK